MIRLLPLPRGRELARGLTRLALVGLGIVGLIQLAMGAMIPVKAVVAQILLERAFDKSVATHQPQRPWSWADMAPVAKITMPRLGVSRIVIDTGSGQAMAFGPTLLPNSAALDESGTSVIAAHRDTHFHFLQDARRGDRVLVEGLNGVTRAYRITGMRVVRWDRFAISPDRSTYRLALTTCYPFGSRVHGPLRYVVDAEAEPLAS
jgi:sortase A